MFYALHGAVLSGSIQKFTLYSAIPCITSFFSTSWDPFHGMSDRLCDIVMKNQALYLKRFQNILMIKTYRKVKIPNENAHRIDKQRVFGETFGE